MAHRLYSPLLRMTPHPIQPGTRALPQGIPALADAASGCNTLESLTALLRDLPHALASLAACAEFDPTQRTRRVLYEDITISILLLGWLPGQSTDIHDHGGSLCAFRVLRGRAIESRYELNEQGLAVEVERDEYLPGSVIGCDGTEIHSMRNDAAASDPLVTLHLYQPAPTMRTYTEITRTPQ